MARYILQYAVHTLDNKELLPAGTLLSDDVLEELRAAGKALGFKSSRLMSYGTVKKDMLDFFSGPPYDVIFNVPGRTGPIMEIIENVRLVLPVLESLDYFKENDFYTYRHILLVFALSILLSRELLGDRRDLMAEAVASPSHDFGKICVPLDILKKSEALTFSERRQLEHHTLAGYTLLQYYFNHTREPGPFAARIARDHHERKNGSGYPIGIRFNDLMLEIVVVSDVYDALLSPRPYRSASYENRAALEELCQMAEWGMVSWEVVKVLVACNRKEQTDFRTCAISGEHRGVPPVDNLYGIVVDKGSEKK